MIDVKSNMDSVIFQIEKDYANKIAGKPLDKLLNDVSVAVLATVRRRVFNDGMDAKEQGILGGGYSTKETYINPKSGTVKKAATVQPKGKYGDKVFKNGKPHKAVYLSDGYKEWRGMNNKSTSEVNLNFTGDLDRSFTFTKINENRYGIGFTTEKEWDKADGNEKRNNAPIFAVGKRESEAVDLVIKDFLNKL